MDWVDRRCIGSVCYGCDSRFPDPAIRTADRARSFAFLRLKKLVTDPDLGRRPFGPRHRVLALAKFTALVEQGILDPPGFCHAFLRLVCAAKSL